MARPKFREGNRRMVYFKPHHHERQPQTTASVLDTSGATPQHGCIVLNHQQVRKGLVELLRALLERASINLLYLTATFLKKLSVRCCRRRRRCRRC